MKYVALKPTGEIAVEASSPPPLGRGDLLVEMKACGLCGTDIEKLQGRYVASQPALGHEASGIVADIGEDVEGFKIGDRVFPHHHVPCYQCHMCRHGSETMCAHYRASNLDPGGFAEYFRVPAWNVEHGGVLKLPEHVTFEEATLIEPTACCIRALNRCNISGDETALVVGVGPIGLTHVLLLSMRGLNVIASDVNPTRLSLAERFGASSVFDATKVDVPAKIKEQTQEVGVDLAIVASGSSRAIVQALNAVRKGGKVCLFGVPAKGSRLDYDLSDIFNFEISIITSNAAAEADTKAALKLMEERKLNLTSLITHRFKLSDFLLAVETAQRGDCGKIIVTP
jgi:L-iditol 2-dehydrogenase